MGIDSPGGVVDGESVGIDSLGGAVDGARGGASVGIVKHRCQETPSRLFVLTLVSGRWT